MSLAAQWAADIGPHPHFRTSAGARGVGVLTSSRLCPRLCTGAAIQVRRANAVGARGVEVKGLAPLATVQGTKAGRWPNGKNRAVKAWPWSIMQYICNNRGRFSLGQEWQLLAVSG